MKLYFGKRKFWKCNLRQCDQQVGLRKDNRFEGIVGINVGIVNAVG